MSLTIRQVPKISKKKGREKSPSKNPHRKTVPHAVGLKYMDDFPPLKSNFEDRDENLFSLTLRKLSLEEKDDEEYEKDEDVGKSYAQILFNDTIQFKTNSDNNKKLVTSSKKSSFHSRSCLLPGQNQASLLSSSMTKICCEADKLLKLSNCIRKNIKTTRNAHTDQDYYVWLQKKLLNSCKTEPLRAQSFCSLCSGKNCDRKALAKIREESVRVAVKPFKSRSVHTIKEPLYRIQGFYGAVTPSPKYSSLFVTDLDRSLYNDCLKKGWFLRENLSDQFGFNRTLHSVKPIFENGNLYARTHDIPTVSGYTFKTISAKNSPIVGREKDFKSAFCPYKRNHASGRGRNI